MATLTAAMRDLVTSPNIGHLATVMPDGSPQVSAVWVDVDPDGQTILVNTAAGRRKTLNVEQDGRVGLSVVDHANEYKEVMIRGRVAAITAEGADAHIDAMAKKYLGKDTYPFRQPGEQRLILRIEVTSVASAGLD